MHPKSLSNFWGAFYNAYPLCLIFFFAFDKFHYRNTEQNRQTAAADYAAVIAVVFRRVLPLSGEITLSFDQFSLVESSLGLFVGSNFKPFFAAVKSFLASSPILAVRHTPPNAKLPSGVYVLIYLY